MAVEGRRRLQPLHVDGVGDDAQLAGGDRVLLAQFLGKSLRGSDNATHPAEYPGLDRCVKAMVEPAQPRSNRGSPGSVPAKEGAVAKMHVGQVAERQVALD